MSNDAIEPTLADRARELQALADVLLPGDGHFPPASAVGAHGLLAERLRERLGGDGVKSVIVALETAAGASLAGLDGEGRIAAVRRFAENQPELFAAVRSTLYFSYYQAPLVVEAVRALGIAYNDAPQPHGYLMDPFDPTPGKDAPSLPRGSYIPTAAVTRLPTLPPATHATRSEQ